MVSLMCVCCLFRIHMVSSTTAGSLTAHGCFFVVTVFRLSLFFADTMSIDDPLATSAPRASHMYGQYKTCVLRQCVERVWCSSFHDGDCAMCANCGRRIVSARGRFVVSCAAAQVQLTQSC